MCCEAVRAGPNCRSYRGRRSDGLERVPWPVLLPRPMLPVRWVDTEVPKAEAD